MLFFESIKLLTVYSVLSMYMKHTLYTMFTLEQSTNTYGAVFPKIKNCCFVL